jgi:3-isopropylmalate/(R)-2-methylmalate dehydratase small subunit
MSDTLQPVRNVAGRGIVVRGNDIDTDQIIPARYMKVVTFDGLGEYAFYDVRYDEAGKPKEHPFNDERFQDASVLIVNSNFGCGSSREHAPQALMRWGIKAVIGESFAEIFAGNCTAMGVPAIRMKPEDVQALQEMVETDPSTEIKIDMDTDTVTAGGKQFSFDLPPAYRNALVAGTWDSTSVLLSNLEEIHQTAARLPYVSVGA